MQIDVYDTYAPSRQGRVMHFDVLVSQGVAAEDALRYAQEWLASVGEDGNALKQDRCRFCHTESAEPKVQQAIAATGYYILQMEGCPRPEAG